MECKIKLIMIALMEVFVFLHPRPSKLLSFLAGELFCNLTKKEPHHVHFIEDV